MKIPVFHVDAFTDKLFSGNPAAVCVLSKNLPEETLQNIVAEHNLPATVFLMPEKEDFAIRWFTPLESHFCGHGTLAASYVIFNHLASQKHEIQLHSKTESFKVHRHQDLITLNLQAKKPEPYAISSALQQELNIELEDAFGCGDERCVFVLKTEKAVRDLKPDLTLLKKLNYRGFVFTAHGKQVDIISRTFYPDKAMTEDYVTGASHRLLAPYWARRLDKPVLSCYQASSRGGYLKCEIQGDRVLMSSQAVLYMQGTLFVS